MSLDADRLALTLTEAGGNLIAESVDGAFNSTTIRLSGLNFQLLSEYGQWRVNIGLVGSGSFFPASFWLAAMSGEDTFPEPTTSDQDLARTTSHVSDLVSGAGSLSALVERMGKQYRESMKQRLQ